MPFTPTVLNRASDDPDNFMRGVGSLFISKLITFTTATQTIGTIPANSIISAVRVVRTTKWDALTTFEIGKSGDTDWLATTGQANLTGNIPAGEAGVVEEVGTQKVVTAATPVILTINQGAATAGAGWVIIEFSEFTRP